jgi:hypothetical protein
VSTKFQFTALLVAIALSLGWAMPDVRGSVPPQGEFVSVEEGTFCTIDPGTTEQGLPLGEMSELFLTLLCLTQTRLPLVFTGRVPLIKKTPGRSKRCTQLIRWSMSAGMLGQPPPFPRLTDESPVSEEMPRASTCRC